MQEDQNAGARDLDAGPFQLSRSSSSRSSICLSAYIFPATPSQRNGIEDARFVHFQNEDGTHIYYATFTAYDGRVVMPELVETSDFLRFRFITLNGPAAQNKGMALFPRKINGRYAMLSRQDNENIYLMFSDNVHFWNERKVLLKPEFPWELVQLGNCGSPIETERRMAGAQPWRRPDAKVLHWCISFGSRRSEQSYRSASRAPAQAEPGRAGRLRAQCRLYLRRPAP